MNQGSARIYFLLFSNNIFFLRVFKKFFFKFLQLIKVFDILGKQVLLVPVSGNSVIISSDGLGSGIYLAKINTDFGATTMKLIKE